MTGTHESTGHPDTADSKSSLAFRPGDFCPHGGLLLDGSGQYQEELRCLLGRRLKYAAITIAGAFLAFLVRDLVFDYYRNHGMDYLLLPHVAITVVTGVLAGLLVLKSCMSVMMLRIMELVLFGLPAAFFVWLQHARLCRVAAELPESINDSHLAQTVLPWVLLIQLYALFVPNTWQRASLILGMMVATPLVGTLAAGARGGIAGRRLYRHAVVVGDCGNHRRLRFPPVRQAQTRSVRCAECRRLYAEAKTGQRRHGRGVSGRTPSAQASLCHQTYSA